jgi:hypothetical protein
MSASFLLMPYVPPELSYSRRSAAVVMPALLPFALGIALALAIATTVRSAPASRSATSSRPAGGWTLVSFDVKQYRRDFEHLYGYREAGAFLQYGGSLRYSRGPTLRCLTSFCPRIWKRTATHYCYERAMGGQCIGMIFDYVLDLHGFLDQDHPGRGDDLHVRVTVPPDMNYFRSTLTS